MKPPNLRPIRSHRFLAVVLTLLALTTACVVHGWNGIVRKAPCPGVTSAALREALASDPDVEIRDHEEHLGVSIDLNPGSDAGGFHCTLADGTVANITVREDPSTVRVSITSSARPSEAERDRLIAAADSVCMRMTAAHPAVGPWSESDTMGDGPSWAFLAVLAAPWFLVPAALWLVAGIVRRRQEAGVVAE